ncbi:cupredoxin domain-containing protein [Candidatus Nitrosotenuis sp. DW1]|uniref:cupredoxin domain-containing protein n=1 Tax=Candidatus Nitrosotenuis sp. DW1 TaxID=2259672 RepID=UPI00210632D8|nr:plastocyanin/azurin family copper-binding protein [Candidatus Nitrosotenuis sp. DW1]
MSNWDLMMPGMGLTAIGITGVTIAYSGIAHTFIDGMHALTGLTLFLGLIFLAAGILEGGVSTSNKAKATTLVILGISFSFGLAALNFNSITTIPTFAGIMLIIAVPSIVIAYVTMKMPQYAKPVSIIFILAVGAAIASYVAFGLIGPSQYLVPPPAEEEIVPEEVPASTAPVFKISILKDSSMQGNPDYDPDMAQVPMGNVIEWTNDDTAAHTVTSAADAGATFDSSLISPGDTFRLDTAPLELAKHDYFCIVHPWMTASFELVEESGERLAEGATATDPNSVIPEQMPSETPVIPDEVQVPEEVPTEEPVEVPIEMPAEPAPTIPEEQVEEPVETETIVSIPAGSSLPGCESTDECFMPSSVTITTGNTVTWTNDDTAAHTVTSGIDVTPDGVFDSSLLPAGKTFSFKFESSGEYPYYCMVHPWMTGKVIVE